MQRIAIEPRYPGQTVATVTRRMLIDMTVYDRMRTFEQRTERLLTDQQDLSLLRTVEDLRWRVRDLENQLLKV